MLDSELLKQARATVYPRYKKPSAYRSMALVKEYKRLGGRYDPSHKGSLKRWMEEDWHDIGGLEYPVFRPTKRVSPETPLTPSEIDSTDLQQQIKRKQFIRGERNLKPFLPKPDDLILVDFESSQRRGKKVDAILKHKITGKTRRVSFGEKGSTTFWDLTGVGGDPIHGDADRRQRYRTRHAGEGDDHRKWSPGFMSYWYLW